LPASRSVASGRRFQWGLKSGRSKPSALSLALAPWRLTRIARLVSRSRDFAAEFNLKIIATRDRAPRELRLLADNG
jgi:hypothetical protein